MVGLLVQNYVGSNIDLDAIRQSRKSRKWVTILQQQSLFYECLQNNENRTHSWIDKAPSIDTVYGEYYKLPNIIILNY